MTPRRTFGDRVHDAIAAAAERPIPVLLAVVVGIAIGLVLRDVTSSPGTGSEATTKRPVAGRQQAQQRDQLRDSPSKMPPASVTKKPANSAGRIITALSAVSAYAGEQDVQVGVAIVPLDEPLPPQSAGSVDRGKPWSTMKVPTAAAYLDLLRRENGAVSGEETIPSGSVPREDLGNALVNSDNLAIRHRIQDMIERIGNEGAADEINRMLESGGAQPQISPEIDPTIDSLQIGTGEWTLEEAASWFLQLQAGCLELAPQDRSFLLKQLRAAPEALHWGAATVLDNDQIALKPGWGSEGGSYTVEQAVIVGNGAEGEGFPSLEGGYVMVVMAVLPSSDSSAFAEGQRQLSELSELIADRMGTPGPSPAPSSC